jgi:hypothetical protein
VTDSRRASRKSNRRENKRDADCIIPRAAAARNGTAQNAKTPSNARPSSLAKLYLELPEAAGTFRREYRFGGNQSNSGDHEDSGRSGTFTICGRLTTTVISTGLRQRLKTLPKRVKSLPRVLRRDK